MFLCDQYVACLFRKSLHFLCIVFYCVLYMCTPYVLEVVFICNKTVYHPAMRNYHTSTLKNAINSVNYLHNRSPEPINFLDNFQLHRRTVRPIGSDSPPVKMFGHRNRLLIFSDVRTTIIFGGPNCSLQFSDQTARYNYQTSEPLLFLEVPSYNCQHIGIF